MAVTTKPSVVMYQTCIRQVSSQLHLLFWLTVSFFISASGVEQIPLPNSWKSSHSSITITVWYGGDATNSRRLVHDDATITSGVEEMLLPKFKLLQYYANCNRLCAIPLSHIVSKQTMRTSLTVL